MRKPKKHNQHLSSTFVLPKPKKTSVQKPLFEDEEPVEPQQQEETTIPDDKKRETTCEDCKKPILYSSDDLHPGLICPGCGHGQNNPNLKGRNWP